jgi:hypothetical protein
MLLDVTQLAYLVISNTGSTDQQEFFYKSVVFLDFLRAEFLSGIQKSQHDCEAQASSVPECMHRWLCRLLHRISHDPKSRKHHAQLLDKAYLEFDAFKCGAPIFIFFLFYLFTVGNKDFLDWSFKNEEEIVSCLAALTSTSAVGGVMLFSPAEQSPLRWLAILRSQFVQVCLCTDSSLLRLEDQSQSGKESMDASEGEMSRLYNGQERLPGTEGIESR